MLNGTFFFILIYFQYGVVLDAGSTHTDMFIYKWKISDVVDGTGLVVEIGNCTVTDEGKLAIDRGYYIWLGGDRKFLFEC